MKNQNSLVEFKIQEGIFKGVSFRVDTSDIEITEEDGNTFLNYSVDYDRKNELIKKNGDNVFLDEVGKTLLNIIENGIKDLEGNTK